MERYEIETFLTLAEELHFRRTAERLGLAQAGSARPSRSWSAAWASCCSSAPAAM